MTNVRFAICNRARARVRDWAASGRGLFASHFVSRAARPPWFTDVSAVPSHGRRVHIEARSTRVVLAVSRAALPLKKRSQGPGPPRDNLDVCRTHLPRRNDPPKRGTRRRVQYPVVDAGHIACSFAPSSSSTFPRPPPGANQSARGAAINSQHLGHQP